MDVDDIRTIPAGLYQGDNGMNDSLETLFSGSKTIDQSDSLPFVYLLRDITASRAEQDLMPLAAIRGKSSWQCFSTPPGMSGMPLVPVTKIFMNFPDLSLPKL